jgi:hypothetical protein
VLRTALDAITAPVIIPEDPGDGVPGGRTQEGAFNVQSLIEAPRKKTFFHNGAFTTLEDAISFYFTTTFDNSQSGGGRVKALFRHGEAGPVALAGLASSYFSDPSDTQDVLDSIGFFLRALSIVYSLEDAQRLTQDAIDILQMAPPVPTDVQALNFNNDLNDITNVLNGAQVTLPAAYVNLQNQVPHIQSQFTQSLKAKNITLLTQIINQLQSLQESVATISPNLS